MQIRVPLAPHRPRRDEFALRCSETSGGSGERVRCVTLPSASGTQRVVQGSVTGRGGLPVRCRRRCGGPLQALLRVTRRREGRANGSRRHRLTTHDETGRPGRAATVTVCHDGAHDLFENSRCTPRTRPTTMTNVTSSSPSMSTCQEGVLRAGQRLWPIPPVSAARPLRTSPHKDDSHDCECARRSSRAARKTPRPRHAEARRGRRSRWCAVRLGGTSSCR